jgi:hypothetical protein
MPATGRRKGHARVHQRQRGAAHRGHRGRPVRLGDLGDHADGVGELVVRRQHGMDGPPGELAVADLAPAGEAGAARLADGERREVVVQHEVLLVGAFKCIDELLVITGAERGHHHGLGLAAGEQRRAVGARQDADLADDLADLAQTAPVDALLGLDDVAAHDLLLDRLEGRLDLHRVGGVGAILRRERGDHLVPGLGDALAPLLLVDGLVGGAQAGAGDLAHLAVSSEMSSSGTSRGALAAFSARSMIASITGWYPLWPNMTASSIICSESSWASDSTIMTASAVPATTRSRSLSLTWAKVGLRTKSPLMSPTRAAPIGPRNGMPESVSAADAATMATMSGSFSMSCDSTVVMTCVSHLKPGRRAAGSAGR